MTVRSAKTLLLRWIRYSPFLVAFCALAGLHTFHVQAQTHVKVTLSISIKDKDTKSPVKKVEISIPRQGTKVFPLGEIREILPEGTLTRPDTDFELTGNPHKLIIVKADGYELGSPKELTDADLKAANSKILEIPIELTKIAVVTNPSPGTTISPTPETDTSIIDVATIQRWKDSLTWTLNYAFWVLGLAVTCLVVGWSLLAILAGLFQKDSSDYQWRIMGFAPLLAKGAVRLFGYRMRFWVWSKSTRDPSEESLQIISSSLAKLLDTNSAKSGSAIHLSYIKDNLVRLATPNKATAPIEGSVIDIHMRLEELYRRGTPTGGPTPNTDSLEPALKAAVLQALTEWKPDLLQEFTPEVLTATSVSGVNAGIAGAPPSIKDTSPNRRDGDDQQRIKALYRRLLDHEPLDCKPRYLEVVMKGSLLGNLADDNVYLSQVGSSQAPFVLLIDDEGDGDVGWVVPNPAQAFDRSTLKDVFPGLNEAQFNDPREQIEPAVVRKTDDGRWMVG
jgi:hypothetical protein